MIEDTIKFISILFPNKGEEIENYIEDLKDDIHSLEKELDSLRVNIGSFSESSLRSFKEFYSDFEDLLDNLDK